MGDMPGIMHRRKLIYSGRAGFDGGQLLPEAGLFQVRDNGFQSAGVFRVVAGVVFQIDGVVNTANFRGYYASISPI